MNTSLSERSGTNELDSSKGITLLVPDDSGGEREVKLSDSQWAAMEWLMNGGNVSEAAEFAGVCRQTVSEWVNQDEEFMAALGAWTRQEHRINHAKLIGVSGAAVATVVEAIRERKDVRAALALLKNLRMFDRECDCMPKLPARMG